MENRLLTTIIISFLNESQQIPVLMDELSAFEHEIRDHYALQFIFVDDGSTDDSFELLKTLSKKLGNVKIVKLSRNYGSHAATRAGCLHSDGDFTVFLPADLQVSLSDIKSILLNHNMVDDIVWVLRDRVDSRPFEKMFSSFYSFLMKKYVNGNFPSKGIETVVINKKVLKKFNENIEANSSVILQILSYGYRSSSVGIEKKARKTGKSKWTLKKKIKLVLDSFIAYSFAPIRFVSLIGIIFSLCGFAWAIYLILRKLIYDDLTSGWPALISVLMVGFGITNISLGIIAEYLWRTLDASRARPAFIIDEIIEQIQ